MADVGTSEPVPAGMKRMILAVNVPQDVKKSDLAMDVEVTWEGTDVTVWDTAEDFVKDWIDTVVPA